MPILACDNGVGAIAVFKLRLLSAAVTTMRRPTAARRVDCSDCGARVCYHTTTS
jgi:hypothetical protein